MCNDRLYILLTRKLSGEATLTELNELDLLVSLRPANQKMIIELTGIWEQSPKHDDEFMEATFLAHLERMKDKGVLFNADHTLLEQNIPTNFSQSKNWFSVKRLALATIVCICLGTGWFIFNSGTAAAVAENNSKESLGEVKTPKGARTKLKLPDGSDVWLNAGSKLNYSKNFGTKREVFLSGEAFFDVVHDEKRPFVIHTSSIDIRVLGTQFNVKAYAEDRNTETSLINGSVEVFLKKDPSKKYLLKPNQKLVLANQVLPAEANMIASVPADQKKPEAVMPEILDLTYLDDNINIESSWTRNILSFEDELFSDVAKKMQRWYDVTITFKNKRWEREYMSGSFENETIEQAMVALKYTTGFNFKMEEKTIIIF